MPVYKLLAEMPHDEFQGWLEYFKLRPYGWRDDTRAGYLMKAQGFKGNLADLFPSLKKPEINNATDSLVGSGLHKFLLNAVGGDKVL